MDTEPRRKHHHYDYTETASSLSKLQLLNESRIYIPIASANNLTKHKKPLFIVLVLYVSPAD